MISFSTTNFHRQRARPRSAATRPFAANLGDGDFNFSSLGGGDEFLLKTAQAALLVLADEFADVLAGRAPIAGGDLSFDVFFQSFGKRDVQGSHGHGFII